MISSQKTLIQGDASQYFQEFAKLAVANEKYKKQLRDLQGETKKLTKEQQALAREAKKAFEDARSPQERYRQKMEQLNRLVKKGTIDQRHYQAAVAKTNREYRAAGQAGQRAFGPQALGQLKSMALGYVGVSQGISAVVGLLRQEKQLRDEIADQQVTSAASIGKLAQLKRPLPELKQGAFELGRAGGARDLREAGNIMFEIESANLFGQQKQLAQLYDIAGEGEMARVIGSMGKIRAGFQGGDPTGNVMQLMSKGLAAAGPVTGVGVADILQATGKVAGTAKQQDLTDEEAMAAISVMSQVYSPDEAKTAVERMLQNIAIKRPELKGKSFAETLSTIQAEKLSAKESSKLFGVRGLRATQRLAEGGGVKMFTSRLQAIEQAQRDLSVMAEIQETRDDPGVSAVRTRRIAEFDREVAGQNMASATNRAKANIARAEASQRAKGRPLASLAAYVGGQFARVMHGDEAMAEGDWGGSRGRVMAQFLPSGGIAASIVEAAAKLSGAADELQASARARPPVIQN